MSFITELPKRALIQLTGPDKASFLQGLITNDVTIVEQGKPIYAALLTPQGKFLFDLFIFQVEGTWLIDCERERTAELIKRLSIYKLRSKVEITDQCDTYKVFVSRDKVLLPSSSSCVTRGSLDTRIKSEYDECGPEKSSNENLMLNAIQIADPRLKELGYRLYTKSQSIDLFRDSNSSYSDLIRVSRDPRVTHEDDDMMAQDDMMPNVEKRNLINLDLSNQYENHRISLGVPDGSRDIPIDKGIILEYGFDELQAIDWKKGCYMGQELTARTKYRGLVRKRLLPVKIEGELPPSFTPIFLKDEEIGEMRTSVPGCGLALLRLASIRNSLPELSCGNAQLTPYVPSWVQLPAAED